MAYEAEEIERAALAALHEAAGPELAGELGLSTARVASAFVSLAGALPASAIVINRVLGLGLAEPAGGEAVAEIAGLYGRAGVARYFVQLHPDARPARLAAMLEAEGLEKARGWQKFSRGREAIEKPQTELAIREAGDDEAEAFGEIVCDAFDLGDKARPWLARLPSAERWHAFMTFDGDAPVGAGAVYIGGDCAWTDFGATAPAHRRRGSQSALLRHRVAFALDHGCRRIFTCTGEEVPGDPQHSYANILKCGFKEDYVRANYAPPKKQG